MRVVTPISSPDSSSLFHFSLLLALLLTPFKLGELFVHEEKDFSFELSPLLVLFSRTTTFRDIVNVLLKTFDPVFEIIDLLFELLIFVCLAIVVGVRLVKQSRGVLELTTQVANLRTRFFSGVTHRFAVEMTRGRFVGRSRSRIIVFVSNGVFRLVSGGRTPVGRGRGIGSIG